jgi:NAD(P)-dependent dehydrogenase (short-subunit alcohol dehydrogenase family)
MAEEVLERCGSIDVLVNNAGLYATLPMRPFTEIPLAEWNRVMEVNVASMFLTCRAVVPVMREQGGGKIVNISSLAALKGLENLASYSAAKAGVIGLTQQAALNYAPDNILINAICPGTIDTPILADITPEMKQQNANSHMIKRLGRPEEIAGKMAYFFSDDGNFSTGLTEAVDGGWSINGRNY